MKKLLNVLGTAGLLGTALMLGGCGDASDQSPATTGQVAIGAVSGATVKVSNASSTTESAKLSALSSITDSSGTFTIPVASATALSTGNRIGIAFSSTGGTFTNMSGATGKAAPDLATVAGYRNITPFTTLYNAASTAAKASLDTLVSNQDIDTVVLGTIPENLLLMAKLNNTIGEALYMFKIFGVTATSSTTSVKTTATWLASTATALGALTPDQALDTATLVSTLTISANLPTIPAGTGASQSVAARTTLLGQRLEMIARKTVTGAVIK
jgi:hypothetical protein